MPLSTHVTDRYGAQYLVNLTNPSDPSATTIDTGRLGEAADDAEADFAIYAGVAYNDTTATHITVAVEGVVAKLAIRTGTGGQFAKSSHEDYIARLRDLALVTGRDRIKPRSDSILQPSNEQVGDEIVRPEFDIRRFDDLIPDAPPD